MPTTCQMEGRRMRWTLCGEIDHHSAGEWTARLERELALRLPQELELDFSGVTFLDSSGIALVLRAYRAMSELGGALSLTAVPAQAARVLRMAGIHRLVTMQTRS
ncbi:MAG TPA: STAS domain-containing protein [Candidatus Onthomonas avicola]|nr:STAS domain-containing protein [Candidatus Onthomonas avicola]